MKEKKDCKIVQDLLPNYIEKLTNEETNNYIEEHLKQCENCQKVLDNMQKDFDLDTDKRDKREVKYIKKFSYKVNILKFTLLVILLAFIIVTGRKMIIISELSNKAEKLMSATNYYYCNSSFDKNNYFKIETYISGDNKKIRYTTFSVNSEWNRETIISTKEGKSEEGKDIYNFAQYSEKTSGKKAVFIEKNEDTVHVNGFIRNVFSTENLWELFKSACKASIKTTTFDGKECYYISNFKTTLTADDISNGMYVDKETGLLVCIMPYDTISENTNKLERVSSQEYVYEFNTVTEEDFIQPNADEYEIVDLENFLDVDPQYVTISNLLNRGIEYYELEEYISEGLIPYELGEDGIRKFNNVETYERIEQIKELKEQGLSIEEMKEELNSDN